MSMFRTGRVFDREQRAPGGRAGRVAGTTAGPIQRTTRVMWWFGAVSAVVSAGAAIQLLVLSTRTADYFAWTIAVPASAAFIGVFYLASTVMGVLALRRRAWAPARVALVPVVMFVGFVLLVTLLHLDKFHLTTGGFPARVAGWIWLVVYVVTPPGYVFAFWWQARSPGGDPPPAAELPRWAAWLLAALGMALAATGVALLVAPTAVAPLWPWELTALTARMIGATLIGMALLAASVVRTNDRVTGWVATVGLMVCAVAALVVPVGYGLGTVQWTEPSAWVYLGVCVLLGVAAAATGPRPPRSPLEPDEDLGGGP